MAVTLTQIFNQANSLLNFNDTVAITDTKKVDIIDSAVLEYSRKRPQLTITQFIGTDEAFYTVPGKFEPGFSEIIEIELPLKKPDGSFVPNNPKVVIDPRGYTTDLLPDGNTVIRFDQQSVFGNFQPAKDEAFWVRFTSRYTVDSGQLTAIPNFDLTALAYEAASLWSLSLASMFSGKADNQLPEVEIVGYPVRPTEWRNNAKEWHDKFIELVAIQGETGLNTNLDFSDFMYWDRDQQ